MIDTATQHAPIDLKKLQQKLATAQADEELFPVIVNAPFDQKVETAYMFLGIIVLLLVNKQEDLIARIALSNTELAKNTTEVSVIPFEDIKIPIDAADNVIAAAIKGNQPQDTTDWRFLFSPALTPEQARINQASAGIAYSAVYPLKSREGGALIFSYFQYQQGIGDAQRDFMRKYSNLVDKALKG